MVWGCLKTPNTELPYKLATPLLGLHLKKSETLSRKGIGTPMLTAALYTARTRRERSGPDE